MEMKLLPHHQNSFSFNTTLMLSLCFLTLIISYMSVDVNCLAAINGNSKSNDRLALIAFKNEITQDPLGILSSWNNNSNSLHFCKWRGVLCSRSDRVIKIDLPSKRLVGSLSPHIGNLSSLKELILHNNSLTGEIPQQIGLLFQLKKLSVSDNSLQGEIPRNISRCSNLIHLNISGNNLVGSIPNELGYLYNLKILRLGDNGLSGRIPTSLGNLSYLTSLGLGGNNLEGSIPNTLSRLTSLKVLVLDSNRLSGTVPSSLYNISSLIIFSLTDNQLHGSIPFDIGFTLPKLTFFSVAINSFSGTIPSSLPNMSRLEFFQLRTNNIVGSVPSNLGSLQSLLVMNIGENNLGSGQANDLNFIDSLVNCTNLRQLSLGPNNFGGELPTSIANFTSKNLISLDFRENLIHGSVPTGIQSLTSLTTLYLHHNLFTGSIPPGIANLQNLGELTFDQNNFSGTIPSSFGNLTQLIELSLSENNLAGLIPSSLGNCTSLQLLDLNSNRLSGSVPKQIFQLTSLSSFLDLGNNSFTGALPIEVGELKNLAELYLSGNKLSGEIPSAIGDCVGLTYLSLGSNFFQGNIPTSLTFLKGLNELNLSHNNLSGTIPKGFETLSITVLDISFNNLEGEVSRDGVFKNTSQFLSEGNSKLCGGIPDLKLPNCSTAINPSMELKERKSKPVKVIIISIVTSVLLLALIVFSLCMYWRRKSITKMSLTTLEVGNGYVGVSYNELLKATNGFNDSTNLLGVGSFGSVYKGILQHDKSKPVAVKVLHLQQRGATKSFIAECDALRKVRHRNLLKIVTCCSSIDFQGNPFKALVFEFMVNGSLENWLHPTVTDSTNNKNQLQEKNLNLERRLGIAVDVASALNYLHHGSQPPIVHCDVKPSNVLLDDDLTAHVGDFGLAKFLFNPSSNSRGLNEQDASSIAIKGSVGYVSPEYGMGGEVSTQGDVYSYGILLLEMFTGKRPTDDMFKDGMNIHNFCKMHELPERIEEVIDSGLLSEITNYTKLRSNTKDLVRNTMRQILATIIHIGVNCSSELPSDRSSMNEVIVDVQAVQNKFLSVGL